MSRCFSYPPPGYLKEGAHGDSANQSIKLEKEKKNTVTEHKKERKRSRDHHKRKRDDKKAKRQTDYGISDKFDQGRKNDLPPSKKLHSEEEGEGSGLTEEHGLPASFESVCYLSDGNGTSRKSRKVEHSDSASNVTRVHGNVIRIRLPLRRPVEESRGGEQQCSTSGRNESIPCIPDQVQSRSCGSRTVSAAREVISTSKKDSSRIELEKREASAQPAPVRLENKVPTVDSLYKALIEDWDRPLPEPEVDDLGDQEWLFGTTSKKARQENARCDDSHEVLRTGNSCSSWPRACYLPEADIYALPFTVPF